jgi:hypothetical protein
MLERVRAVRAQRPAPRLSERQIAIVVAAFNGTLDPSPNRRAR